MADAKQSEKERSENARTRLKSDSSNKGSEREDKVSETELKQEEHPLVTIKEGEITNYDSDKEDNSSEKAEKPSRLSEVFNRRSSKRKTRFSIRSRGSVRSRFSRGSSISEDPDESCGDLVFESGQDDMSGVECGETADVTMQTTKEQGDNNILSWLNAPGATFGSSVLLASPSYLDIYADTISDHAAADLEVIEEEVVEEEPEEPEDNEGIFSNPGMVDTCEGHLQLAQVARMIAKDKAKYGTLFDKKRKKKNRWDHYKRVMVISVAFLLLYSSYYGIRNAQTSLGNDRRLSILAYGATFLLMWFGSLCGKPAVHHVPPKYVMAISSIPFIAYPLSNVWPSYFTLLPIAVITGFASGLIWASEGIYIMNIASAHALVNDGKLVKVITKFNSIVFSFFMMAHVVGNLLTAVILSDFYLLPGEREHHARIRLELERTANSSNSTLIVNYLPTGYTTHTELVSIAESCGLLYKPGDPPINTVYKYKKYLFFGVCVTLATIGSLLLFFALKPLKVARVIGKETVRKCFRDFLRLFARKRLYLLIPMMSYFGVIITLVLSDYNSAFTSCVFGAGHMGFIVVIAFLFSVAGAYISGKAIKKIGRVPVIVASAALSLLCVVCMLIWKPQNSDFGVMVFIPLSLWGFSDGILFTQISGFLGVLFKKEVTEALTIQSVFLAISAVGATFLMAYGWMSLRFKVWLTLGLNIVATICYVLLEWLLKKKIL